MGTEAAKFNKAAMMNAAIIDTSPMAPKAKLPIVHPREPAIL
ncbi:MAG: hypothetical protein RXR41_02870 [Candidatus Marsarchaeota archaeon]